MKFQQKILGASALLFLLALWMNTTLYGQNIVTGDISGTVTDPSGAVVPNAKVELKSAETGFDKTTTTGASGGFRFPLLKPGQYTLNINTPNFTQATRVVTVNLGQVTNASTQLAVGSSSTTVEVTGEAPILQTDNANISTTFDTRAVQELPNPGGDLTYYAQTSPGIAMNTSGGGYGNFSAFGLPATSNLFTENGNDENDPFLNLNNSGASNLLLGRNEVQEVAVVTNGYTGQYGRQAGANVNYTTKSGTNHFHGDATWDWNGSYLNANEWFNNHYGTPRPFANNNQWAADFGGPIRKNSTFFYVDTEGVRYVLPSSQDVYFPTPAFATATLANVGTTAPAQLPFYQQMMSLYQSSPAYGNLRPFSASPAAATDTTGGCEDLTTAGFGAANPCVGWYHANGKNLNKEWLLTARLDQNLGSKDVLFGRFKTDHGEQPTSTDIIDNNLFGTHSTQPSYEGQLNETHTFGANLVNSLIASGLWYSAIFVRNSGEAAGFAALPFSTVSFGANPMSSLGGTNTPDYLFPQGRNVTQYQVVDDLALTKGKHELKIGVNFRRNDMSIYDVQVLTGGWLNFGSMTSFYTGNATGSTDFYGQAFTPFSRVPLALYSLGVYAQDTWKVTSNLTLTLALRADRNSNAVCQINCFSDTSAPFSSLSHDSTIPYNQAIDTGQHRAFPDVEAAAIQPRFGFAYTPGILRNTVFRGGIGLFSDLYPGVLLDNMIENPPNYNTFFTVGTAAPGTGSAAAAAAASNASFVSGFNAGQNLATITAANPFFFPPNIYSPAGDIRNPKYIEWNFQMEHGFGPSNLMSLNYVGNHGYDILVTNPGLNVANAGTSIAEFPSASPDLRFGTVTSLSSEGISNYDGLVTSFTHRFTHGFQAQVNYTWSHALDDTTSYPSTPYNYGEAPSITTQLDPACLRCLNYSNSDADVRHNFTANYVWDTPFKFGNHLLNQVLGGWQFAETFFLRSGTPYSAIDSTIANALSATYSGGSVLATYTGGPINGNCTTPGLGATPNQCLTTAQFLASGTATTLGSVPRNAFRGPGYFDSDFHAMKSFKITERMQMRLGANFFNVFNHPNFQNPVNDIANPSFGQILATVSPPTSPYGSFQGAGVSGRLIQMEAHIQF